jgi:hypothetical protein
VSLPAHRSGRYRRGTSRGRRRARQTRHADAIDRARSRLSDRGVLSHGGAPGAASRTARLRSPGPRTGGARPPIGCRRPRQGAKACLWRRGEATSSPPQKAIPRARSCPGVQMSGDDPQTDLRRYRCCARSALRRPEP